MYHRCATLSLCLFLMTACSAPPAQNDRHLSSPHFRDGVFHNLDPETHGGKSFLDVLKWRFTSKRAPWPDFVADNATPDITPRVDDDTVRITMINHASLLIQGAGVNVITDPIFSERASPLSFAGPKRHRAPGIAFENLPPIDAVLVSHAHYEHLDRPSLQKLEDRFAPRFFTPLRNHDLLPTTAQTAARVTEMDWDDSLRVSPRLEIVLLPAQHWSARGLFDRNQRQWGAFLIRLTLKDGSTRQVYFAGDTGYGAHFKAARKAFGPVDVALLPIGAYEPRWFMRQSHTNPDEALEAHKDLGAAQSIGMHFGTFQLSDEAIDQPICDLEEAKKRAGLDPRAFVTLKNGQTFVVR